MGLKCEGFEFMIPILDGILFGVVVELVKIGEMFLL